MPFIKNASQKPKEKKKEKERTTKQPNICKRALQERQSGE